MQHLGRAFPRLWRLPWENCHKEILGRLAVDGVPYVGGPHAHQGFSHLNARRCPCGAVLHGPAPARAHYFWECPVAVASLPDFVWMLWTKAVLRTHEKLGV